MNLSSILSTLWFCLSILIPMIPIITLSNIIAIDNIIAITINWSSTDSISFRSTHPTIWLYLSTLISNPTSIYYHVLTIRLW